MLCAQQNCMAPPAGRAKSVAACEDLAALRHVVTSLRVWAGGGSHRDALEREAARSALEHEEAKLRLVQRAYVLVPPPPSSDQPYSLEFCVTSVDIHGGHKWIRADSNSITSRLRAVLHYGEASAQFAEAGVDGLFPELPTAIMSLGACATLDVTLNTYGSGRCFMLVDSAESFGAVECNIPSRAHTAMLFEQGARLDDAATQPVGKVTVVVRWLLTGSGRSFQAGNKEQTQDLEADLDTISMKAAFVEVRNRPPPDLRNPDVQMEILLGNEYTEIIPHLFLAGDYKPRKVAYLNGTIKNFAPDFGFVVRCSETHSKCSAAGDVPLFVFEPREDPQGQMCVGSHCFDIETKNDLLKLKECCIQIKAKLDQLSNVLVHCQHGVDQSATVVAAFCMAYFDISTTDARECLKRLRPACTEQVPGYEELLRTNEDKIRRFFEFIQEGKDKFDPERRHRYEEVSRTIQHPEAIAGERERQPVLAPLNSSLGKCNTNIDSVLTMPAPPPGCHCLELNVLRVVHQGRRLWSSVDLIQRPSPYVVLREELQRAESSSTAWFTTQQWEASSEGTFPSIPCLAFTTAMSHLATGDLAGSRRLILEIRGDAGEVAQCPVAVTMFGSTLGKTEVLTAQLVKPAKVDPSSTSVAGEVTVSARWRITSDLECPITPYSPSRLYAHPYTGDVTVAVGNETAEYSKPGVVNGVAEVSEEDMYIDVGVLSTDPPPKAKSDSNQPISETLETDCTRAGSAPSPVEKMHTLDVDPRRTLGSDSANCAASDSAQCASSARLSASDSGQRVSEPCDSARARVACDPCPVKELYMPEVFDPIDTPIDQSVRHAASSSGRVRQAPPSANDLYMPEGKVDPIGTTSKNSVRHAAPQSAQHTGEALHPVTGHVRMALPSAEDLNTPDGVDPTDTPDNETAHCTAAESGQRAKEAVESARARVRIAPSTPEEIWIPEEVFDPQLSNLSVVGQSGPAEMELLEDEKIGEVRSKLWVGVHSLSAEQLCEALRRASDFLNDAHTSMTEVWRAPLSLLDMRQEDQAFARGVPLEIVDNVRAARSMTEEAVALVAQAEAYERQIATARREKRCLARAPLLELFNRMRNLAQQMRDHLPALGNARAVFDFPLHGDQSRTSEARRNLMANRDSLPGTDALPDVIIEDRAMSKFGQTGLLAMETCIDVIHLFAALTLVDKVVAKTRHLPVRSPRPVDWRGLARLLGLGRAADSLGRCGSKLESIGCACHAGAYLFERFGRISEPASPPEPSQNSLQGIPRLTTGYWNFRGLAAPLRMMCAYAGAAEHEDIKYETWPRPRGQGGWIAPEWERKHKPELQEQNALVQLPYVLNRDTGSVVGGSRACYLYLGRVLGLGGHTFREQSDNEQVLFYVHDMQMEFGNLCHPFKAKKEKEFREALAPYFQQALPAHYGKLEHWLRQRSLGDEISLKHSDHLTVSGGWPPFLVAASPCVADFVVWEVLDQNEALAQTHSAQSPLAGFELLRAFYERVEALPRLKEYFESYDATLPINNKMAFFVG